MHNSLCDLTCHNIIRQITIYYNYIVKSRVLYSAVVFLLDESKDIW